MQKTLLLLPILGYLLLSSALANNRLLNTDYVISYEHTSIDGVTLGDEPAEDRGNRAGFRIRVCR